jgi:hypothetical protein
MNFDILRNMKIIELLFMYLWVNFNSKCWVLFILKSSSVSQSVSPSSNPCVQRKSSHASDRKGSRRRMDTEDRKDKGMLFFYGKQMVGI